MRKSINLPKKHNKSEAASKDAASFHLGVVVTLIFFEKMLQCFVEVVDQTVYIFRQRGPAGADAHFRHAGS